MRGRIIYVILYGTACWQFGILAVKIIWTTIFLQPENNMLNTIITIALFPISYWWMWKLVLENERK